MEHLTHHANFLPPRFFEFLHHVDAAAIIVRLLRSRGEPTDKACADLHEEQCQLRDRLGIADHPDYTEMFDRMQSIYDALEVFLDEAAGLTTPQPVAH